MYSPFWFDKKSPLQAVIHALKYQQIPQAGIMLGEAIGREIVRSGATVSYVVPVPLHKAKFREREYNQAEFVARGVVLQTGAKLAVDCVRRVVNTRTQTELTAVERRQNVEGAFELQSGGSSIQPDKPVLLVDDVLTTGATIRSVASLLRRAGHSKIYAGTIAIAARTQP